MSSQPDQRPEGALIQHALKRSGLSAREAARRAEMSEGRWRQVVSGYQTVSAGVHAAVTAPAGTVARMALVVGVSPDDLRKAGREDAADALDGLLAAEPVFGDEAETEAIEDIMRMRNATEQEKRVLIATYRAMRQAHGQSPGASTGRHPAAG